MLYEEMGVRPSSVDSQHPACMPDVSLYRHFCRIPLYPIPAIFLPPGISAEAGHPCTLTRAGDGADQTGVTALRRVAKLRSFAS